MPFMNEVLIAIIGALFVELVRLTVLPLVPLVNWRATPRIGGDWEYRDGRLRIRQYGRRITAIAMRKVADREYRKFRYRGQLVSGQLVLTWEDPQMAAYSVGAMVLKVTQDGGTLRGKTVYVKQEDGSVVSFDREYRRVR